jgi:hypothetical protein
MLTYRLTLATLGVAAIALGCRRHAAAAANDVASFPESFQHLPLPPEAQFVSKSGSKEALQIVFKSTQPPPVVANYYRGELSRGGWHLVSDTEDSTGAVLFAEQNGPPLWVRVSWDDSAKATIVSLTGAVVSRDTTKRAGTPLAPSPARRPG